MRLHILYLARLRDALGHGSEEIDLAPPASVATLLETLRGRGGPWAKELAAGRAVRVAVNQQMGEAAVVLGDGDEVAFFPPVTGG